MIFSRTKNTLGDTPLMQPHEIRLIERALLALHKKKICILEWGSGGSTLYFTKFLEKHGIDYDWTSLEYNKRWFKKVLLQVGDDERIHLYLFDVGNTGLKQRYADMESYINFPKTFGKKFDLILVDGRKRRRCALLAKSLLLPGGSAFIHDAQRPYYQCVFKEYPDSTLLGPYLWRGKNEPVKFFQKTWNQIRTAFFISLFRCIIVPVQYLVKILRRLLPKTNEQNA